MAELSKDIAAGLAEFLKNMPAAPKGPSPEAIEAAKKRAKIKARAFKSTRFAYYIVGRKGAYSKGKLYKPGELIKLALDKEPGVGWFPATKDGVALAEAAEVERLRKASGSVSAIAAAEAAELEADGDEDGDEVEDAGDVEPEPDVTPPAPAPKKKTTTPKPAPKKKGARASDTDVG